MMKELERLKKSEYTMQRQLTFNQYIIQKEKEKGKAADGDVLDRAVEAIDAITYALRLMARREKEIQEQKEAEERRKQYAERVESKHD